MITGKIDLPVNTTECSCGPEKMAHLESFVITPQVRNPNIKYKNPPFKFCPWCGGILDKKSETPTGE